MPYDLYDAKGELSMRAGETIEPDDIKKAAARITDGLFLDEQQVMAKSAFKSDRVPVRALQDGMTLPTNLYDDKHVLVLPAGSVVSQKLIGQFGRRGLRWLFTENHSGQSDTNPPSPTTDDEDSPDPISADAKTSQLDQAIGENELPALAQVALRGDESGGSWPGGRARHLIGGLHLAG